MSVPEVEKRLIETVADFISVTKYFTALSGHAVSAESGVPPFKLSDDERWDPDIEKYLQGYELFKEDPHAYWQLYQDPPEYFRIRRERQETAAPNPVHFAMKELEELEVLKFLVTESPDNLYRKVGLKHLVEIHGNIFKMRCGQCGIRFEREKFADSNNPPICPECQGFVKTDVVHFGEPIPEDVLEQCNEEAAKSDMMIVVGSSAEIYPAAALPQMVKQEGGRLVEINPAQTAISLSCDVSLRGNPGEILPLLVEAVRERV